MMMMVEAVMIGITGPTLRLKDTQVEVSQNQARCSWPEKMDYRRWLEAGVEGPQLQIINRSHRGSQQQCREA